MNIVGLDHLVLTVKDINETVKFYTDVLGMVVEKFTAGDQQRIALKFGNQKINLHQQGREFKPGALVPLPGAGDFCLICDTPVEQIKQELEQREIPILQGPVEKTGATGPLQSIYIRDPDQNLVELSNQTR
ncbi:MAG: VOC family protein [Arenicellales bacterium]